MIPATLALAGATPPVFAHYMPWFAGPTGGRAYGFHWTGDRHDPARTRDGRPDLAARHTPLLGPYDSGDPELVEAHVRWIRYAGFAGVLVDWYGDLDLHDYAFLDRNTDLLFRAVRRHGLKFGLVYEDQTVPQLLKHGRVPPGGDAAAGRALFARTFRRWMRDPAYVRVDGKPLLMVFGPQHYAEAQWREMLADVPVHLSFLFERRAPADSAFDWPMPERGEWRDRRREFLARGGIPVAFPRFLDWNRPDDGGPTGRKIEDADGRTYRETLAEALRAGGPLVQVATFNDWGEDTQVEPSVEFGYRDLEETQRQTKTPYRPDDLRRVEREYRAKKRR